MPSRPRDRVGPARVLALTYGLFVLAAGARSGVQIATKFTVAPGAYLLSAVAAAIYTAGLVVFVIADHHPSRRHLARVLCVTELLGVLLVGTASILFPDAFPDATVWSGFGAGYGYVPLALPILGLAWTRYGAPSVPNPPSISDRTPTALSTRSDAKGSDDAPRLGVSR